MGASVTTMIYPIVSVIPPVNEMGGFSPLPGGSPFYFTAYRFTFRPSSSFEGPVEQSQGLDCSIVRALLNHGYQQ